MPREGNADADATLFDGVDQPLLSGDDFGTAVDPAGSDGDGHHPGSPTDLRQLATESGKRPFRHGVLDCCGDMDTCCCGFWCTPCLYGMNVQTMKQLDGDADSSWVAPCAYIFGAACLSELLAIGLTTLLKPPMVTPSWCGFSAATLATGFVGGKTRRDLRKKYNIERPTCQPCGFCSDDIAIHIWCHPCALCQERRELKALVQEGRNLAIQANAATAAPPPQQMEPRV